MLGSDFGLYFWVLGFLFWGSGIRAGLRLWGLGGLGFGGFRIVGFGAGLTVLDCGFRMISLLGGSWDLVTRVIIRVTLLITTYNPN